MQKRIWIGLLVGAAVVGLSTGCATLTQTPKEAGNTVKSSWATDVRAIADDWNMIWMVDRQTHLTRWHTR